MKDEKSLFRSWSMRRNKAAQFLESKRFRNHVIYRARKRENELFQRCVRCPNTVTDGYACCCACRQKMAAAKHAARMAGFCIDCWTRPALPDKKRCALHDDKQRQYHTHRYTERLLQGFCTRCGKIKAQPGKTQCIACTTRSSTTGIKEGGRTTMNSRVRHRD